MSSLAVHSTRRRQRSGRRIFEVARLSDYLKRAKGLAILTPDGWKLTQQGRDLIAASVKRPEATPQVGVTTKLRSHLGKIKSDSTRAFADEAIKCQEHGLRRSAVVSAWVAAVGVLYDHVLANKLAEFNTAGMKKMQAKWTPVASLDDLADLKESTFLELCESASIFGKTNQARTRKLPAEYAAGNDGVKCAVIRVGLSLVRNGLREHFLNSSLSVQFYPRCCAGWPEQCDVFPILLVRFPKILTYLRHFCGHF
jgi:hypothetical protein